MIRVEGGSRLHFGIFRFAAAAAGRSFGGVGMMVAQPALILHVEPADDWSAAGPRAERALGFARQFAAAGPPGAVRPHRIVVEAVPPEHAGLGSGTQLALAVARALAASAGLDASGPVDLAERVGRGKRSAIGIHGSVQGGFLVEAGKRDGQALAPLIARVSFPEEWRLVLAIPEADPGLHGPAEIDAFRRLDETGVTLPTDALCRLVLLGMLPALAERDLHAFGAALYEFNRKVGEAFASVQGGPYAGAQATAAVEWFRRRGVRGVAQSSWGPTVCAVVENAEQAARLAQDAAELRLRQLVVTTARNESMHVQDRADV